MMAKLVQNLYNSVYSLEGRQTSDIQFKQRGQAAHRQNGETYYIYPAAPLALYTENKKNTYQTHKEAHRG